jgi:hypothetical protein
MKKVFDEKYNYKQYSYLQNRFRDEEGLIRKRLVVKFCRLRAR